LHERFINELFLTHNMERVIKTFNNFLLNSKRHVVVTITDTSLIIDNNKIPIYDMAVNVVNKRKVDSSYVFSGIGLFVLGAALEFAGGVANLIGHIIILFGLANIGLGFSRKIICAEIRYSQGKCYLCSKKHEDVSFLAVCVNKIKRGDFNC